MFEAVRARLIGAWHTIKERGFVGLFFFELFVVTLGVLLAQAIADRAGHRDELAGMEEAKARADLEMADAAMVGRLWAVLGQCFEDDLKEIDRAARSGSAVDPILLRRPGNFTTAVMPLSEQTKLLIREKYGDDAAYNYDRMQRVTQQFDEKAESLLTLWGRLSLYVPDAQSLDALDRARIRETAALVTGELESARSFAREMIEIGENLALEPKIIGEYGRFAKNCAEYRSMGRRMYSR